MENIKSVWENLHTQLKSFIMSKVHDSSVTDDILQEVFIKAHSQIGSLKDRGKIVPWLYQIARNQIVDHFRSMKRTQFLANATIEADDEYNELTSVMETAIRDMIGMMDDLPKEYCQAICAIELEGISQKSYSESNGIPYSTVKSRVQRARLKLRDMMMRCCHYQFDQYGTVLEIKPIKCCCCSTGKI
jgi:RNA polymerase sigma-70 factor (ECF subfamily)